MLSTGTHTLEMDEPETCAQELQELALAMESEVLESYSEVLASLESEVLRRSPGFSPPPVATGGGDRACDKARLGLGHEDKNGKR